MRPQKISDEQLFATLTRLFQAYGYEGTSLSRIAKETGLEKASLYHRFPGGKEEMMNAVLARADEWFRDHVFSVVKGADAPGQKLKHMANAVSRFYDSGKHSCLLDTLSLQHDSDAIRKTIGGAFANWITNLATVYIEGGVPKAKATRLAEDTVAAIQGGLVLARGTGNTKPFQRALTRMKECLS